jgi:hypothetical protein
MNESSSNQDTGTEMLAEEEHFRRDLHPLDLLCDDWETTSSDRSSEYNDYARVSLLNTVQE